MRRPVYALGLVVSLLAAACGGTKDGYVVLDVDSDGTVDKAAISQLVVSIASETRSYPLTATLPGSLGILTSRQGTLTVSVVGIGNQKTQGSWSGTVSAAVGQTSRYPVRLSCVSGTCGTVVQRDGAADGVGDDGGAGTNGSGGAAGVTGMDGGGGGAGPSAGTGGTAGTGMGGSTGMAGTTGAVGCADSPSCKPFTKFKCGDLQNACDNRTQVCCRKFGNSEGTSLNFHCADIGTCGAPDNIEQSCNGAINCPTGKICANVGPVGTFQTITCVDPSAIPAGKESSIFCHAHAECPTGFKCTPAPECLQSGPGVPCVISPLSYLATCQGGTP